MTATIDTPFGQATITDGEWTSEDKELIDFLNSLKDPLGPSGADPNPDATAADRAIEAIPGSKMVSFEELDVDPSVIY